MNQTANVPDSYLALTRFAVSCLKKDKLGGGDVGGEAVEWVVVVGGRWWHVVKRQEPGSLATICPSPMPNRWREP